MAHKDIKRKRLTNHSQLKFTPARVQRDSAASPHQRPYPSSRSYYCAPSPVKQTPSPSLACGLSRPVRKLGDDFPAEEEEVVEEEEDEVSFRHITSQSLREARWTSQGGVRISSASGDTCPSQ